MPPKGKRLTWGGTIILMKKIEAEAKGEEFTEPEPEKVMKEEMYDEQDWERQNNDKPIWTLAPKDVSDDQYNEFFKTTFKEFLDPLAVSHFKVSLTNRLRFFVNMYIFYIF